ncbi:MAG: DNA polymerase III subunit delta [Acidimicrobiales bacterium]
MTASAYLINGDDATLVSEALSKLLDSLCGDSAVPVEEHTADSDEGDIAAVLDALVTPPFLADRRIVVLRGANRLDAGQASQLAERVKDPIDGNVLVLVVSTSGDRPTRAVPTALSKAVKAVGEVIATSPGQGRQRSDWFMQRIRHSDVRLDAAATRALLEHLGEDVARLGSVLQMLEAAYGDAGKVGIEELVPFLGDTGGVPPWDLTDALDKGDGDRAIAALHRMMEAGDRHPLAVLSTLHRHYGGMLRLDGADIRNPDEAASILKMSPYPAKKILEQGRRLGHERVVRAIEVIADADANLRGLMAWPSALVMEVLVARLAQLARSTAAPARS